MFLAAELIALDSVETRYRCGLLQCDIAYKMQLVADNYILNRTAKQPIHIINRGAGGRSLRA
jgi:hypothetical protein